MQFEFDDVFHPRQNAQDTHEETEEEQEYPEDDGPTDQQRTEERTSEVGEEFPRIYGSLETNDLSISFDQRETDRVSETDFQVLKLVGKGGYGSVFQVRFKPTDEIFAMKVLRKDFLIQHNNVAYTKTERDILRKIRHPFIVSLHFAFQTKDKICLVMDFVNGGQLLFHLRKQAMFGEQWVRFYASELLLALETLHELDIIHRDLKPENLLLDADGHLKLTDFGLAKEEVRGNAETKTWCGTVEYMAPEMIRGQSYGKAADWWSFGILIYDMMVGEPPFTAKNQHKLQQLILSGKYRIPKYQSPELASLLKKILNRDPNKRLGSEGAHQIKKHPFFKTSNWGKLLRKEVEPPFRPEVKRGKLDVENFDTKYTMTQILRSPENSELSASQQALFHGFTYVRTPEDTHSDQNDEDETDESNLAELVSPDDQE